MTRHHKGAIMNKRENLLFPFEEESRRKQAVVRRVQPPSAGLLFPLITSQPSETPVRPVPGPDISAG